MRGFQRSRVRYSGWWQLAPLRLARPSSSTTTRARRTPIILRASSTIMTDSDGVQQAHRYQAIVVNVMLFAIGVLYVWQHLAYPTFDQSWLELLGISGLAQVAGKGTIENKN